MGCTDRPIIELAPQVEALGQNMAELISNPEFDFYGEHTGLGTADEKCEARTKGAEFIARTLNILEREGLVDLGAVQTYVDQKKGDK